MLPSAQSSILAGLLVHQQLGGEIPIVTRSSQYTLTTHYDKLILCALRKHKKEKGLNARHLLSDLSRYARFSAALFENKSRVLQVGSLNP
jgi:hypothetical protein